jgi:hypothetical protein
VAKEFGVSLLTVQRWLARAGDTPLDLVDWSDRSSAPLRRPRRTPLDIEDEILRLRRTLSEGALGENGAAAIVRALAEEPEYLGRVPSVRTVGRILERRGALDWRHRRRPPAPPRGWYLSAVAEHRSELDSFDTIEGLRLRDGTEIEVLTGISLHGGLPLARPGRPWTAARVLVALFEHWSRHGLPDYAQFDNAMIFHGTHARPDVGPVSRLCLGLGVIPVFVAPRETGFQAGVESFNGRWQAKCWGRFEGATLGELAGRSDGYVDACRSRAAVRIEAAPARRLIPAGTLAEPPAGPTGQLVYLRRTNDRGEARVLGQTFAVARTWPYRLVRIEIDLATNVTRFFALRRRDPLDQPLLREIDYSPPWRRAGW